MNKTLPLYYYPADYPIQDLKDVILGVILGVMIQPYPHTSGDINSRILAIGAKPETLIDYAYIDGQESPHLKLAVSWALGLMPYDISGPNTIAKQLSTIMGGEVREVVDTGI